MADVSIDATISTATSRGMRSLVFIDADVGYQFYIDSGGTFVYRKTTDGGASWGSPVTIEAATTNLAFDVWFDQWTPGDTSGSIIHTAFFDTTVDDVYYRNLDTSTDTLGSRVVAAALASAVAGIGAHCSIVKAVGGNIYITAQIDAGGELRFLRSTDGGGIWASRTSGYLATPTGDWMQLLPAANTGDAQDCLGVYFDSSANSLLLRWYDDSGNAWTSSSSIATVTENTTDLTGQYPFSASIRHSDKHLILSTVTERDTATADHRVFDLDRTSSAFSITEKTAITTNIDDHYYPSVFIDQGTDDIYVAFNGLRDGSETLGTTTKVYYTKSTDDGTTWSAGSTAYMEGATAAVLQTWAPLMGPRFGVSWRTGTTLNFNKVNSVTFAANVSGSVSVTEAADTLAASGTLTNDGTLAVTEALDTLAASGSVPIDITGSLAVTEALDTLAAAATLSVSGSVEVTEALDTLAASGSVPINITGSLAITEAADALAASGVVIVAGSVAATEASDLSAITGAIQVSGALALTEADDTLAASGSVPMPVSGSVSAIEADDVASASGEVEILEPPAGAIDGPWRLLTGEYPKPRKRPQPVVIPFPPELPPAPKRAPPQSPILVVVSGESPYRDQLLGSLVAPVSRGTPDDEELAIALLLAA